MRSPFVENACLRFVLEAQNNDGGWGFHVGSLSRAEPTAWALIALIECASTPAHEEGISRATQFLAAVQLPDGSWSSTPEMSEGSWVTSLVCLALLGRKESSQNLTRGLEWLCKDLPGETGMLRRLVRHFGAKSSVGSQNESYFGWSWTAGTASWVEPTSYAMVCLRATRAEVLPATAERRLRVGEALLFDRMCPGGGWNCGNPMVYGVPGEPQVASTVWALLALRDHPDRPEVQQSVRWLEGKLPSIQSPASLALALIAMNVYGIPNAGLADSLRTMYEGKDALWVVPEVAVSALALGSTQNWLQPKSNGIRV